jgi:hypothetical protein
MSLTFTEKLGLLRSTIEFMEKNADELKTAGFNTDIRLGEQQAKYDDVAAQNEKQESLKVELYEQTKLVNDSMRDAYVTASGNIDAMAGILSKDSQKSKILKQLRSRIRRRARVRQRRRPENS